VYFHHRNECSRLRRDLNQQKEDENRAALQHLAKLKDEEIAAVKRGWEGKVAELQRQVKCSDYLYRVLKTKFLVRAMEFVFSDLFTCFKTNLHVYSIVTIKIHVHVLISQNQRC